MHNLIIILTLVNTTLQLFSKKEIVQGFLVYNEFAQNIKKESDPVRQNYYTTKTH